MAINLKRREVMRMVGMAAVGMPILSGSGVMAAERGLIYVGTYTSAGSKGIQLLRMNMATGELSLPELVAETVNPSYLAIAPNRRYLYAANEVSTMSGRPGGGLTSFAIDPRTAALRRLNEVGTRGASPCYVEATPDGRHVLAANYSGGNVIVVPFGPAGILGTATDFEQHQGRGADPQRQSGPRAHCILVTPDRKWVLAVDLGLDRVMVYRWDGKAGTLEPNDPPFFATRPGAGPRHIAFHRNGRLACLINELDSTLVSCTWDARKGELKEVQTVSTLPEGFKGTNYCADVHFHPGGRFVYGTNRGHDSLAIWRIDERTGRLDLVGHESTGGRNPRNFVIDPTGRWLLAANQASDSIVVFRIDEVTGRLTRVGQPASVSMPVCLKFL